MPTTVAVRAAGVIVVIEGVALLGLAAWQVLALIAGDVESPASAVALVALTVIAAAAVLAFGGAILRGISWGRSGAIVTQLLILAVALGAITGAYADPLVALALAVPALVAFVLLLLASRRAGARRADSEDDPRAE